MKGYYKEGEKMERLYQGEWWALQNDLEETLNSLMQIPYYSDPICLTPTAEVYTLTNWPGSLQWPPS